MDLLTHILKTAWATIFDVLPILIILLFFHFAVLRTRPANLRHIVIGFIYVLLGLTLFLVGLEEALFPLGQTMARQLTAPGFISQSAAAVTGGSVSWATYGWVYAFGFAIGFATTVAEPALIAVALKAEHISGGTINAFGLRMAVALGVAIGVALGVFRIVSGTPLPYYIIAGYAVVMIQTAFANRSIIALAFDSGGVTTSTVTVPVLAALGVGLAGTIPGRSPLIDGFGLIAFASLFPIMSVLGYAGLATIFRNHASKKE